MLNIITIVLSKFQSRKLDERDKFFLPGVVQVPYHTVILRQRILSIESALIVKDQSPRASALGCHPRYIAPGPYDVDL